MYYILIILFVFLSVGASLPFQSVRAQSVDELLRKHEEQVSYLYEKYHTLLNRVIKLDNSIEKFSTKSESGSTDVPDVKRNQSCAEAYWEMMGQHTLKLNDVWAPIPGGPKIRLFQIDFAYIKLSSTIAQLNGIITRGVKVKFSYDECSGEFLYNEYGYPALFTQGA